MFKLGATLYNTLAAWTAATGNDSHSIVANPLLTSDIPSSVSPAIGSGNKYWGTEERPTDINGKPFPDYFIDIGAVQSTFNPIHPVNIG
jgi:hypothetical protein